MKSQATILSLLILSFVLMFIAVPLVQSSEHKLQGIASWYGARFHGRTTANCERFDMHALTAAHKTLPLGSIVKVSLHSDPSKTVIVRINDRGPYVGNRIIDLSKAAATLLGIHDQGIARVKISLIKVPSRNIYGGRCPQPRQRR